jgi:hypothetical protein
MIVATIPVDVLFLGIKAYGDAGLEIVNRNMGMISLG